MGARTGLQTPPVRCRRIAAALFGHSLSAAALCWRGAGLWAGRCVVGLRGGCCGLVALVVSCSTVSACH